MRAVFWNGHQRRVRNVCMYVSIYVGVCVYGVEVERRIRLLTRAAIKLGTRTIDAANEKATEKGDIHPTHINNDSDTYTRGGRDKTE